MSVIPESLPVDLIERLALLDCQPAALPKWR
jgi:hypothetical protein